MMLTLATSKLAILAIANLVGSTDTAKTLVGISPPLRDMFDIAFSHYDAINRRRLRDLSNRIAKELTKRTDLDEGTSNAILLETEKLLANHGLSDEQFAALDLNSIAAADKILSSHHFATVSDKIEMEGEMKSIIVAMYESVRTDPELFQGLLPHIFKKILSDFDAMKKRIEAQQAVQRSQTGPAPSDFHMGSLEIQDYYIAKCPASLEEYDRTAELTKAQFTTPGEVIDLEKDRIAFKRNPYSMVVLLNRNRDVVGFIDIYHLPDDKLDAVPNDKDGTAAIDPNDCLGYAAAREVKRAYIATILVKEEKGICVGRRTAALIYGMCEFLLRHQFYGTDTMEIWAIASTSEGKAIMTALQFSYDHLVRWLPEPSQETRGVYRIKLQKAELLRAQARLFDDYYLRNIHLCIEDHTADPFGAEEFETKAKSRLDCHNDACPGPFATV